MIGELVDNVIGVFSPERAFRRQQYRNATRAMGGIEAGKKSRTHDLWAPANRSADSWIQSYGKLTRARARDLYMNNSYARGGVQAFVRNVVGRGIRPQSRTENEQFNESAERLFNRWVPHADVTGRMDFFELQRAVLLEVLVPGETIQRFVDIPDDPIRPVPFALESIDIDRLADDEYSIRRVKADNENEIRLGFEYDSLGRMRAAWISKYHPNDINGYAHDPVRVSADEILHLYYQERVGQTRGISKLAPVVWWLKNLDKYVEAEVVSRNVAACFGVAIKTMEGGANGGIAGAISGEDTSDDVGNRFEFIEPGMVARLMPGEDITAINPSRQSAEGDIFIKGMLRSAGVGMGLGYSRITKDFSQTTFSSARAEELEDRKEFRMWQDWMVNHYCRPVWRKLVESAVVSGMDGFPSVSEYVSDPEMWLQHEWLAPGWEWVDPKSESAADQTALENNIITLEDIWLRQGKDPREQWAKVQADKQKREELGLIPKPMEQANGKEDQVPEGQ